MNADVADEKESLIRLRLAEASTHSDELLGFLRRRVGDAESAADLRQEVFLRLASAGPAPIADLRAYLFSIARRCLVDRYRSRRAEVSLDSQRADGRDTHACEAPGPQRVVESANELAELKVALGQLSAPLRQSLLWYQIDGVTLREIGKRLGVSESMAGRYVKQAMKHCQGHLGLARSKQGTP
ncbi:MAG: RNA polymerase sigma factor [Gammaproteobacteria bacterium]